MISFSSFCKMSKKTLLMSAAALFLMQPALAQDVGVRQEPMSSLYVQASLGQVLNHNKVQDRTLLSPAVLHRFYNDRDQKPYWLDDGGPTHAAQTFFERIEQSWTQGLNPETYHYSTLSSLWNRDDFESKASAELLLSDAFLRYVRDMSGMRVSAERLGLEASHWKQSMEMDEVMALLHHGRNIGSILASVEPQGSTYKKLQKELVRLVENRPDPSVKVLQISLEGILRPGNSHRSIPLFRERLGLKNPVRGKYSYDEDLYAAVVEFQKKNGLNPDGVIGSQTIDLLNKTHDDLIRQVVVNLERFRWVDFKGLDRFVVVNIPSATLWAMDDGDVDLQMPVIVGKPQRKTEIFRTEIEGMRFNPTWTVPPTIKRADILPKLRRDISYLNDKGIDLYRGYGEKARRVDPNSIDWGHVSWRDLNDVRMVQRPGDNNALGRFRVLMPNKHNIYLHDTNHREYFTRPDRALSSGCVRLKYPQKMAEYVMAETHDWNNAQMQEILASMEKTDIPVDEKIPVYILYYTAWTGEDGRIVLGRDVYKRDEKLYGLLREMGGVYIPGYNL